MKHLLFLNFALLIALCSCANTESPTTPTTDYTISETQETTENPPENTTPPALLTSINDIGLYDIDGADKNYAFHYNNQDFRVLYTPDNWKIIDSYKIQNTEDIEIICQALKNIHPIHNADMNGYRTADDMAYEWNQHNLAYILLSDDSQWKNNVKDVDINPSDQGKNLYELFSDRTKNEYE